MRIGTVATCACKSAATVPAKGSVRVETWSFMARSRIGFFQREARWLVVLTIVVPIVGILAMFVIPRLLR